MRVNDLSPNIYKRGPIVRYGAAVGIVALAMLLRLMLIPVLGPGTGYITLLPAILIAALFVGRGPAILAGALGTLSAMLLFKPEIGPHAIVESVIVIGTAVLAGWSVQNLQNARAADRQILESIPGMVFTTRPDGYCDYQSRQWVDYTGVPMSEHLGDGWKNLLHPDDQAAAYAAWQAAIEGLAPYDIEYRVRRHDGKYEWFKVRGHPIRDAEGRIVRWFGVAVNIDAFRHSQEELQTQKKELEAIIRIVSHDLRAPLVNIRGFTDILKNDWTRVRELFASEPVSDEGRRQSDKILAESAPEAFGIIEVSARAMNNLVESLLKVARAGLVVPKPEPVDMNRLVEEVIATVRIKVDTTGTLIDVSDLPPCFADPTHVAQVFTNLIDNAVKYLDPNRRGQICIEGTVEKDRVLYCVSDNGIGIEPKYEEKIFDIFYRVDGQTGDGEGIGLSVVKRMVERNGGRIWLVSEPGKGSNFFVALPRPPGT